MKENLAKALAYVDQDEGPELNLSPGEPGGSSKHGVSMETLREWHVLKHLSPPTMEDMKAVNTALAGEIYTALFADVIRFNDLRAGIDYRVFDATISAGRAGGPWALEDALGRPRTGKMSDDLVRAANAADPNVLIPKISQAWLLIKIAQAKGSQKSVPGWTNRLNRANSRSLAMVASAAAATPAPAKPAPAPAPAASTPSTTPAPKAPTMAPAAALDTSVKGKTGSWKGIIGVGMKVDQFREYVAGLRFTDWKPSFMVLHNTGAPKLSQWHSVSGAARMANLTNYYKNEERWSGGPHAFVADDLIWPFTPMTGPGVHTPSWNGIALGIELVGDYNVEDDDAGVGHLAYMNAVAVFAIVHAKLGLNPETIRFHKEDKGTTHRDCPGRDIEKPKFIQDVMEFMGEAGGHPAVIPIADPAPAPATPAAKKKATVNTDDLNLRQASSAAGAVLAKLKKGTVVTVNRSEMNGETSWTSVIADGQWGWVSSRYLTPAA